MKPLDDAEFTIIGTGLMGSSLALALRGKAKCIRGVDRNAATLELAARHFDEVTSDLARAVKHSDVVVLAAPVRTIVQLLDKLKTVARPGTLILDLGSSKGRIVEAMNTLPDHLLAVGGHPMCGKENSGPDAADPAIFWDRVFVLCPTLRSTPEAIEFAREMVAAIGSRIRTMPADRHDRAVAAISHLPYALSVGLVQTVIDETQEDGAAWDLAASGFRDTSRLAGSDLTMMGDTLLTNRDAVLDMLSTFRTTLDQIEAALQSSDEAALRAILEGSKQARDLWFEQFKNSSK
jgi:prephenate dehydrogenase